MWPLKMMASSNVNHLPEKKTSFSCLSKKSITHFSKYIIHVLGKNWMILIYCKLFKQSLIIWHECVFYKCYCLNVHMNIIFFFKKFKYLQVLRLFVVSFYLRVDSLRIFFLIKLYEKEPWFKEVRLSLQTLFF